MNQLPAYLQNKTRVDLNTVATAGMGGALPPHISIRGNAFTLIDAAGNKQPIGAVMYACVIDILGVMAKRYYDEKWKDGADDPPKCWSTNGIGPSRESQDPQASTCSECQWNVRGSATSALSGKGIKACRDEKIVALLLPQYPGMLFQLVIPPGSFKNWSAFTKPFENSGMDVSDVMIAFGFQPQVNGVMTFEVARDQQGNGVYMPEHLVPIFNKAIATEATDILVGRNDVPIALPLPRQQTVEETRIVAQVQQPAPFGANTVVQPNTAPQNVMQAQPSGFAAPTAGGPIAPQAGAPTTAQPEQPRQRKRRTQAEIAADNAAKAAQAGGASPQPQPAPVQPQAPFPIAQPGTAAFGAAPAVPQGGFGGQTQQNNPLPAFGAAAQTANPSFAPQGQPSGNPTQQAIPTAFGQGSASTASPSNAQSFGIQQGTDPNVDPQLAEMLRSISTPS